MKYRSVVATRRGGPEVLQIVENDLHPPAAGEVRVKVLAASITLPDVEARYGHSPFPPKTPFTPGYAIVGVVDALSAGVTTWAIGDRAAVLTVYGGYAEYIYRSAKDLIPVPAALDPAEVVPLILNYIVAYQTLHRSAKVKTGDKVLIIGASGGIGTTFLQLGRLASLKMYGVASRSKHPILREYGAVPIDYRMQDFVAVIRQAEPDGLDAVLDGMGGDFSSAGFSCSSAAVCGWGTATLRVFAACCACWGRPSCSTCCPAGNPSNCMGRALPGLTAGLFCKIGRRCSTCSRKGRSSPSSPRSSPSSKQPKPTHCSKAGRWLEMWCSRRQTMMADKILVAYATRSGSTVDVTEAI